MHPVNSGSVPGTIGRVPETIGRVSETVGSVSGTIVRVSETIALIQSNLVPRTCLTDQLDMSDGLRLDNLSWRS
jgi:hypothetical protein